MMKIEWRELAAALAPGLLLALWGLLLFALLAAMLEPSQRQTLWALLESRGAMLLLVWMLLAIALGHLAQRAWRRWIVAPAQLAEQARVLASGAGAQPLAATGAPAVASLATSLNALVAQRTRLEAHVEQRVQEASRGIEQEKSRLAALMSELTQSVVVCNLDGRVLLYNNRARLQFRALSDALALADGGGLIGIGRSIYAVLDRALIAHALESVQQRLARGVAHPSAQFVTTTQGGQLLRVQLAAVRAIDNEGRPAATLNGFVLMLHNVTRELADEWARDQMLHQLTEGSRSSLANLQAAVELLEDDVPDAAMRARLSAVVRDEVAAMSRRITELARETTQTIKTRWPLEDMQGADLIAAALRRLQALAGCQVGSDEVDSSLWLKVDSYSLLQLLVHLATRLVEELDAPRMQLRLVRQGQRAQLDLVCRGLAVDNETLARWETEPFAIGEASAALSVRDIVERHGGGFWFERGRANADSCFRLLLPLAGSAEAGEAMSWMQHESRPEYYDFDLFEAREGQRALADSRLADLDFTVFDCETTGLEPSQGDRVLQIGATRIVAGKLRRQECFEQLVNPQRDIPEAGMAIHGIRPEMVANSPPLAQVLPAFHRFAADTVLIAHNAAFDMRFLQLAEEETGVRFEQPVLDTLLLSAVVHPQQDSHRLEAIAERLGVTVLGRHTALGDAIVTAEVFTKLVPLLAAQGITTLGQALEASRKTYHARLSY